MKIVTSPAKLMQVGYHSDLINITNPYFIEDSEFIQSFLKDKTPNYLSELMNLSPKLSHENWERNQNWTKYPKKEESSPAIFAFTGEVYRGLGAKSLNKKSLEYLQENYMILSGLYGLLRPSDRVMLYRLEMGRKFGFDKYKNLYDFWSEKITDKLNLELQENDFLLNLASNEYFKVINRKKLKSKVIDFEFYELKSGTPKTIVVYTKHARGLVVRYCAENNVKTLEELKAFNYEGYILNDDMTEENKLVFVR